MLTNQKNQAPGRRLTVVNCDAAGSVARLLIEHPFQALRRSRGRLVVGELLGFDTRLQQMEAEPEGKADNEQNHFGSDHWIDRPTCDMSVPTHVLTIVVDIVFLL